MGKDILDAMIYHGECEPLLVVVFQTADNLSPKSNSKRIIEEVLPYTVEHLPTYAESSDPEDIKKARDHFGLAGFSNGSFYTMTSGLGTHQMDGVSYTCLDYISWFGMFAGFRSPEDCHYEEIDPQGTHKVYLALFCVGTWDENGNQDRLRKVYPEWMDTEAMTEGENAAKILYEKFSHNNKMTFMSFYNYLLIVFTEYEDLTSEGAVITTY